MSDGKPSHHPSLRVRLIDRLVRKHQDAYHLLLHSRQLDAMMDHWVTSSGASIEGAEMDMKALDAVARAT